MDIDIQTAINLWWMVWSNSMGEVAKKKLVELVMLLSIEFYNKGVEEGKKQNGNDKR